MLLKCTKVVYMVILSYFGHSDSLKSSINYESSTFRGSYSPKSLHKIVLPENVFKAIFCEVEMLLKCPKVVYMVNLSYFGHSDSLKSPTYYESSTFRGSYSPKSLHKFVLPENVFKNIFCEVECSCAQKSHIWAF